MVSAREGEPPVPAAVGTTTDQLATFAGLMPGTYRVE